ncbi:MAG: UDP-N-acetylmuramoyl-tripeptide--D-alanyl-D-alanine ligase [Sphingomonadaceae bacterium]|uniref:UDP-N-acetylmuramoyl-tripeptide--D-alanyl-D- alanine ligase n=1 Tax=Thermaurantiacus sp. TaxID=2820283 RepID=UPI00298F27DA|nr:UDP-N-acetylmuramoyl-tripeptide--D-alanyl-D-alanine ligase [Thermaurantiacus sp.]MCS6986914.1 UDP-N-acetylmuramoyl-tripeptide--D-alanyl-D-alanine ligase [Sphingomonadaceae bacterium]MDW8415486.1 UDP-N-acetylmuramoyl-tripeptide--D-alanyl-D-alanine ligase [Thermaurantiacus sp.]
MTPLWTAETVAAATGGQASASFAACGITFDSREVQPGDLFVALRGQRADGHDFVPDALARGAVAALVDRPVKGAHVRVPDTLEALRALARAARARSSATVVGVTGSVGKTGVKEALAAAFRRMAPEATHASVRSYNNHTGVPLSLARMPADTRLAVFEMGMNRAGEIRALTRLVRPHVAVITWVASVHLEFFASEEGIAEAKAEILEGLEPGGVAVLPADNRHFPRLAAAADARGVRVLSFGTGLEAHVRPIEVEPTPTGTRLLVRAADELVACTVGIPGAHWINNALAVLAAVQAVGGDLAEAGLALAGLSPPPGRGARIRLALPGGPATLIDESYNANPASMTAALAVLAAQPAERRLAVLGEMRELGPRSAEWHRALAEPIAQARIARLALVGPGMAALQAPQAVHLDDWTAALAWARAELRPGDVLMVKGSNAVGLGHLVEALRAEFAEGLGP